MRHLILILTLLMIAGCTTLPARNGDILVIGDSVMAWNGSTNQDIAAVIADRLERDVTARPVPGAMFVNDSRLASAVGLDISAQYRGGDWRWVVMNGGANDFGFGDCGCGDCTAELNHLIGPDGETGKIPAVVNQMTRRGAKVLWMGYYTSPGTSFQGCRNDLVTLEQRVADFADRRANVYFFDGEDVIDKGNPDLFASDDTHPSPRGSALLGTALADLIAEVDGRSQKP